ncbi:MAG: hypothetical protein K6D59_07195 [Bacteroidales bacterium]|nr:hypothetical protein [Bacteroidales bacterium]
MQKKKDQFIIAYLANLESSEVVISHASYLSEKLGKGLILLHICDGRYSNITPSEAETELKRLCDEENAKHNNRHCTYAALRGDTKQTISSLPTIMNAVVIVAQVDKRARWGNATHPRTVLRNFADCRAAFLTVQEPLDKTQLYNDAAMAVDFKKESKDKFIWSSYFPRFLNSKMHVLYYDYRDEFLHQKWYANMQQLHKLYSGLNIKFQPHIMESKSTYLDINTLRFAEKNSYGIIIAVTTKEKDGLEFFIGTQERRTIVNKQHIPILFLNPREDLYVLCD